MGRRGFGAVASRKNSHVAALIAEFPSELFHDRCFAGAADSQVADGNDLHAQRGIAEDAHIIEKAAGFDCHLKDFRATVRHRADEILTSAAALLENDFQQESLKIFCPDPDFLTHPDLFCQGRWERAREAITCVIMLHSPESNLSTCRAAHL